MMDLAIWTEFVPIITVVGGSGALVQRFLVSPYLASRRQEREALRERMDRMSYEIAETRKEMHMMHQAFLEWKGKCL